jgi:hypothetical protein
LLKYIEKIKIKKNKKINIDPYCDGNQNLEIHPIKKEVRHPNSKWYILKIASTCAPIIKEQGPFCPLHNKS